MAVKVELNDNNLQHYLRHLKDKMSDLTPFFRDVATLLESQARQSFYDEKSPAGVPWKPSQRKLRKGGKTLIESGRLVGSITSKYSKRSASAGTNVFYGEQHQKGGTYTQQVSAHQRKKRNVRAHTRRMTMPKRAFLPERREDIDWKTISEIFENYFNQ